MKILIIFLLSLKSLAPFKAEPSLSEIRNLYMKATTQEEYCTILLQRLYAYNDNGNMTYYGYKAGATILSAKYKSNPITKLNDFIIGKNMLEKAIAKDKSNIELRFLRYGIQTNAPYILGYNKNITEDQHFLKRNFEKLHDQEIKNLIRQYLLQTENARSN